MKIPSILKGNNKITLHIATSNPSAYEYFKPTKGSSFLPDWWRKLPNYSDENTNPKNKNMKGCTGMIDLYKKSIILPMWSDLSINVASTDRPGEYNFQYGDYQSTAEPHPVEQRGDYLPETQYQHLKLVSPWHFYTDTPVDWLMSQPVYNFNDLSELAVLPGVVNTRYTSATNVQLIIPKAAEDKSVFLRAGQPIAMYHPLTERRVDIEYHLLTEAEITRRFDRRGFFSRAGMRMRILRRDNDEEGKKCPFGFSKD